MISLVVHSFDIYDCWSAYVAYVCYVIAWTIGLLMTQLRKCK